MAKKFLIDGNRFLRSSSVDFHYQLLKDNNKTNVKGGGWWERNEEEQYILLYDESVDFGKASKEDIINAIRDISYTSFFKNIKEIRLSRKHLLSDAMNDYEVIHKLLWNDKRFYQYDKPNDERTIQRLEEIYDLGMTELSESCFGIEGKMSGLYIEKVWNYNDQEWNEYIEWVKEMKLKK